jgi:hypothetical protein
MMPHVGTVPPADKGKRKREKGKGEREEEREKGEREKEANLLSSLLPSPFSLLPFPFSLSYRFSDDVTTPFLV